MPELEFYLEKRDGLARLCRLEIEGFEIETPCLVKFPFDGSDEDGFSKILSEYIGKAPYPLKKIYPSLYDRLERTFPVKRGIKVLSGLWSGSLRRDALDIMDLASCEPVYVTAAATPLTIPVLVYLGADILDNILAIKSALEGVYFLPQYELSVEDLKENEISILTNFTDLMELVEHNTRVLEEEVRKCRILIEREEMRNYVEAVVKLNPELTALLRIADDRVAGDERFSRFKKSRCLFSSMESPGRFEVRYFLRRTLECYEAYGKAVLVLPCTATKPYMLSPTHREIRRRVRVEIDEIIVSSPLVVPREFELLYPACNYDTPVTGRWSDEEVDFVSNRLAAFLEKGGFEIVIGHVSGGYRRVLERAASRAGCDVLWTAEDGVLSRKSIENLSRAVDSVESINEPIRIRMFRAMFRYQFGVNPDAFGDLKCRGRYPRLELYGDGDKIARVDVSNGCLDIYGKAVRHLIEKGEYCVRIGDFEPKSKVFASGVEEVYGEVRPNDVIVFHNNRIYGVGVAVMSGEEMVECRKGLAFRVRRMYGDAK